MKLKKFKKLQYEDFVGFPEWFRSIFEILNPFIESINTALMNNLTFRDNHACQVVTTKLTHGTEKTISAGVAGQVGLVLVGKSPAQDKPLEWSNTGNGAVRVTASFTGSPSDPQDVVLFIFGE